MVFSCWLHRPSRSKIIFKEDELGVGFRNDAPEKLWSWSKEAYHYTKMHDAVRCALRNIALNRLTYGN